MAHVEEKGNFNMQTFAPKKTRLPQNCLLVVFPDLHGVRRRCRILNLFIIIIMMLHNST